METLDQLEILVSPPARQSRHAEPPRMPERTLVHLLCEGVALGSHRRNLGSQLREHCLVTLGLHVCNL